MNARRRYRKPRNKNKERVELMQDSAVEPVIVREMSSRAVLSVQGIRCHADENHVMLSSDDRRPYRCVKMKYRWDKLPDTKDSCQKPEAVVVARRRKALPGPEVSDK